MKLKASHSFIHSSVNICAVLIVPYNYLIYHEAKFKEQNAQTYIYSKQLITLQIHVSKSAAGG